MSQQKQVTLVYCFKLLKSKHDPLRLMVCSEVNNSTTPSFLVVVYHLSPLDNRIFDPMYAVWLYATHQSGARRQYCQRRSPHPSGRRHGGQG